ncbi:histidinol-phosphatase [Desulfuribacillus alkaliarsenatis]|uniref:Histidinol-phosphatase n=1 Tax=Desulfuribacillus alkaliarsenatis TaxID=766136 RepID=A0A1E5G6Y4_9FIRM|nr:histidinol-phosphatase [Desulfuribacillus alkaliarsenatis]OEF98504.1 histidinol phosphatase [Desulfuribacillus alkaliarsenatis]
MLTDYHVHVERGKYQLEWLQKFIDKAKEEGITELGISEHAYRFKETKEILYNPWIAKRQTESIDEYLDMLFTARENGINIKVGIEMDYIPGKEEAIQNFLEKYPWDYVIGSIHWIDQWGFDLSEMKDEWSKRNVTDVYKVYFETLLKLTESKLFDIVGHFDVIKIFGHVPEMRDDLFQLIDQVIDSIATNNLVVEVSTAGYRKPVRELYPKPEWLSKFYEKDIPICLSSDAHTPEDVGSGYEDVIPLIAEVGYDKLAIFNKRKYQLLNFR